MILMTPRLANSLYRRLTPVERHRLAIEAYARGDLDEVQRLSDTCPQQRYWSQDPNYAERMKASLVIAFAAANFLLRASFDFDAAVGARAFGDKVLEFVATEFSEATAEEVRSSHESAMVERGYAERAAAIVGVSSGIGRFCGQIGVDPLKFLSLEPSCLPAWEIARDLAEAHLCDHEIAETVHERLTSLWAGFVPDAGAAGPQAA